MKLFLKCLIALLTSIMWPTIAPAGTVDNATLSPASSDTTVGTIREITFSATNDKPFALKEFSAKIKYGDGLVVSDLVTSPPAVKAEIYPKRNLIALEWEDVPPGTELKAISKVSGNIGSYSITPWRMLYLDYTHDRIHGACNTATVNIVPSPVNPTIGNVSPSNIAPVSATISWSTDQPTTGQLEYGTTTSYGSSVVDNNQSTSHSVTLSNLAPASTYHFRISATNGSGLSTTTGDGAFTTSNIITIKLIAPLEGETIARPDVNVTGTIVNATGNETGVKVNGIIATVFGNEFSASHVPLQPGQNTVAATAVDTAGNTAVATAIVTAVAGGDYIQLTADAESGIAPFETTLRVGGSCAINASNITTNGPGPVEFLTSSAAEYRVRMATEGIYRLTVNATAPDGSLHQDQLVITVLSKGVLDALLKGKWEGMKSALATGNTEEALNFLVAGANDRYRQIFSDPTSDIVARLLEIENVEIYSVKGKIAQGGAIRMEADGEYAYPLTYVRDENGIWKILGF